MQEPTQDSTSAYVSHLEKLVKNLENRANRFVKFLALACLIDFTVKLSKIFYAPHFEYRLIYRMVVTPEQLEQAEQSAPEQAPEQTQPKITTVKSPGRVAAGKKLAELNRKNKAKKIEPEEEKTSSLNVSFLFGAAGVLIAAGSLYLQWRSSQKPTPPAPPPKVEPPKNTLLMMD